jgi:hypothetical protein
MIFGFVAKHRGIWCEALGVSRSGLYLNRRFLRVSSPMDAHPISFIPRSISARNKASARSTPAWPVGYRRWGAMTALPRHS